MKKLISLFILVIVIATSAYAWRQHVKQQLPHYTSVVVEKGDIAEKVVAVGSIMPKQAITVKSAVPGIVADVFQDEGQAVKRGQPLLRVQPESTPKEYAVAKQNLAKAIVTLKASRNRFNLLKRLVKQGNASPNDKDYLDARAAYRKAGLDQQLAKQQLDLIVKGSADIAGKSIANVITSPVAGVILQRNVNKGDPVVAQTEAQVGSNLFTIANMHDLIFEGQVSEMDVAKIAAGMPAKITIAALPGVKVSGIIAKTALESEQMRKQNNNGKSSLGDTNGESNPFNVGFKIKISQLKFPKDTVLRSGFSATATVKIKQVKSVPILPERVVDFLNKKPYVWIQANSNIEPKKQFITLGLSDGVNVQIVNGLQVADKVISNYKPSGF